MAIDYYLAFECEPKRHFGNGDCSKGAVEILEGLKSKNRAAAFRQMAEKTGRDPTSATVTLYVHDRDGKPIEKKATLAELEGQANELESKAGFCTGCPANFLGQPYGCFAAINYPISEVGEKWLLSRVQPGTLGAALCLDFMREFKIKGSAIQELRKSGYFECKIPTSVTLKKGWLSKEVVTSDQLLETIFMIGNALHPTHCFGILIWLNAIKADESDAAQVEQSHAQGEKMAELELGPASESEAVAAFQALVKALYLSCWLNVPLIVSA